MHWRILWHVQWLLSPQCLPCLWSAFSFCCTFCFRIIALLCNWLNLDILEVVPSYFLIFPFPSQILPVRCLVSCLKHQYHLHSVLPCIKLFSVSHQHQSGGHIFFLVEFLITQGIRKRENACSALPILLFLRDSPRYIGVARKMMQFCKQQNVTVIHVERNNRRSDEPWLLFFLFTRTQRLSCSHVSFIIAYCRRIMWRSPSNSLYMIRTHFD